MLNISENTISSICRIEDFKSFGLLRKGGFSRLTVYLVSGLLLGLFLCLFLPWTQNIQAEGYVTTRSPQQRPQAIQSVISGRLEKWYVQEGDFVEAGDTIVYLSEVKSEYFDPELVERTSEQVDAKAQSIDAYDDKVKALDAQYSALQAALKLKREQVKNKIEQVKNKIVIDSIDLVAFNINAGIAENQVERIQQLYDGGLKTLTELQEKKMKYQQALAKVTVQQNKLNNQRNELANMRIEFNAVEREYADKLAKSQSDRQSALSAKYQSVAETSKLRNLLSSYSIRQQFYYLLAPQSGYITKTLKKGLGEIVKEGLDVATIMPAQYDLAVEIYLKAMDLPLISLGNSVRLRFDGWPAIVISGWPETSTGIFTGEVVAIDQFISDNGLYRILISPADWDKKDWPEMLRVGTGTNAFLLLKDVPIWYEIWRQLNGFPPDYYAEDALIDPKVKRKAPLKSVK